ncbi:MAG TPA: tetratricopeptide repeat protein [Candidatus Competibacteraceae bacterium]|nr:tetratricopeptide repeat protein [Candidatus Competibacteraceae bacterium]
MNRFLQPGAGLLALIVGIAGCAAPYLQSPSKPVAKAPIVDRSTRSARRTPTYPAQPAQPALPSPQPPVEVGQLPREDPLMPREYASPYPGTRYSAERYPSAPTPYPTPTPAYPDAYGAAPAGSLNPTYPTTPDAAYPSPAYPPGAAYSSPSYPYYPDAPGVEQDTDALYEAAPAPDALPPSSPVSSQPARPKPVEKPVEKPVALAPPVEPEPEPEVPEVSLPLAPPPQRPAPPPRPAELPPAEITREGNQAVVALLDSADKYVKSNQLDKAGAALERALRIEPRNAGIWHDLAQIRLHQGQYQQAETLASKSNNLAGGNRALQARNWKLISVARQASGNKSGAEEAEAQASLLSR